MKCQNCGFNQFYQDVTIKTDLTVIVNSNGKFMDFSGDLNDIISVRDIVERDNEYVCCSCDTPYQEEDSEAL